MKRWSVSLLLLAAGCKAEPGTFFRIVQSPVPVACSAPADATGHRSAGFFDPTGDETSLALPLSLENNMNNDVDRAALVGDSNTRIDGNDITLVGFDACYYRGDLPETGGFDPERDGLPVDCEKDKSVPREFIYAAGNIDAGGGRLGIFLSVMGPDVLKGLYGAAFDPGALVRGKEGTVYYNEVSDPSAAARDAAWGNFPTTGFGRAVVQLRAFGRTEAGGAVRSNWFAYGVDVCPGCILSVCGNWAECPTAPDLYSGQRIPADACRPFSGLASNLDCEDFDECPSP